MAEASLKDKALSGMFWTAAKKYATMIVSFISSIILARLLTPYDYGCIGMLAIFMSISDFLIDGGFGSALIQKKRPTDVDYSTIFYWNMFMSVVIYLLLFCCAPMIARYYKIPELSAILRVQGIILFINALKMVQSNQLRKQFRFKPMTIVSVVSSILSVAITIILAYMGCGVWALVAQNIIIALIPMICFWCITKWKPALVFSKQSFKELFSFGGFMFLTGIVDTISKNIHGLLIGKVFNANTMGYYSKAKSTEELSSNVISQVVSMVTYQLYAEVQDEKTVLHAIIKRLTTTLAFFTFPLLFIMILVAKPVFVLLYSDRWLDSVPYFQVLCLAGFAYCLEAVNTQVIAAIGKSKTMFSWTFVKRCVTILLLVIGLALYGMTGLLIGIVIGEWIAYFINIALVSKHIGYNIRVQLMDLLPIITIGLLSFVFCYYLGSWLDLNMYLTGGIQIIVYVTIYLLIARLLNIDALHYCMDLVKSIIWRIIHR